MRAWLGLILFVSCVAPAQTLLFDGFETTGFVSTDGGFTALRDTDALSVLEWTKDAGAISGEQALLVRRTMASGSGPANSDFVRGDFVVDSGVMTVQVWLKLDALSGVWGAWPIQVHGLGNPEGTNAEVYIRGTSPLLTVQTTGRRGYQPCVPGKTLPNADWHLLELVTTGGESDAGLARGFLDGVLFCSSDNDWSGYPMFRAFTGTGAYDRAWVGSMVLDEYRVFQGIPVNRLVASPRADAGVVGDCVDVRLTTSGVDDPAVLDRPLNVRLHADGGALTLCGGDGGSSFRMTGDVTVGLELKRVGLHTARFTAEGLLGAEPFTLRVDARDAGEAPDAGVAVDAGSSGDAGLFDDAGVVVDAGLFDDAGVVVDAGLADDAGVPADAGVEPGRQQLAVGCSCTSDAASGWWLALVVARFLRTGRRTAVTRGST